MDSYAIWDQVCARNFLVTSSLKHHLLIKINNNLILINYTKIINFVIQFTCLFDLNPNFLNKLPPEDVVRGEQRKLGQINTKFRKTYLILYKT